MKTNLFTLVALVCAVSLAAFAGETTKQSKSEDSPLVKAAKESGGPRKPAKKVITNADVKKAGGKLTVLPSAGNATAVGPAAPKNALAKQAEQRRQAAAAAKRVEIAAAKVKAAQSELDRVEESYYASDNPDERDTLIRKRFAFAKQKLEAAQKSLAEARAAEPSVTAKP